jgi:protein gp37
MADKSKIEWTEASWNPIRARNKQTGKIGWHCEHATTGCQFCYAENFNRRLGTRLPFKPGHRDDVELFLDEQILKQPLRWKRPRKIFVGSMTDVFADFVPDAWLDRMFAAMALSPRHTFQVLTKRAARMRKYFSDDLSATLRSAIRSECFSASQSPPRTHENDVRRDRDPEDAAANKGAAYEDADNRGNRRDHRKRKGNPHSHRLRMTGWLACDTLSQMKGSCPLPNVWLGVSAERQQEADERIPLLLQTPAAVRFISAEPLLGPIDLWNGDPDLRLNGHKATHTFLGEWWEPGDNLKGPPRRGLDWVIVGGESGPGSRPMHPDWARSLRDQCAAAGVPFFFKQWGEWAPGARSVVERVGKKRAGRVLDGKTHSEFPTARSTTQ